MRSVAGGSKHSLLRIIPNLEGGTIGWQARRRWSEPFLTFWCIGDSFADLGINSEEALDRQPCGYAEFQAGEFAGLDSLDVFLNHPSSSTIFFNRISVVSPVGLPNREISQMSGLRMGGMLMLVNSICSFTRVVDP
jgi:hypothetical protein